MPKMLGREAVAKRVLIVRGFPPKSQFEQAAAPDAFAQVWDECLLAADEIIRDQYAYMKNIGWGMMPREMTDATSDRVSDSVEGMVHLKHISDLAEPILSVVDEAYHHAYDHAPAPVEQEDEE